MTELVLTLPDDWFEVSLEPGQRDVSIRSFVGDLYGSEDLDDPLVEHFSIVLREQAASAWDLGASSMYLFSDALDEAPFAISASLVVTFLPIGTGPDSGLSPVTGGKQIHADVAGGSGTRDVSRDSHLVARSDQPLEALSVRYTRMLPDENEMLLMSFSSPTLELEDDLVDLFDAIAEIAEVEG